MDGWVLCAAEQRDEGAVDPGRKEDTFVRHIRGDMDHDVVGILLRSLGIGKVKVDDRAQVVIQETNIPVTVTTNSITTTIQYCTYSYTTHTDARTKKPVIPPAECMRGRVGS